MGRFRSIIFDWDGCLADTLSIWLESYRSVFEKFEVKVSERQIIDGAFGDWRAAEKFGIDDVDLFNRLLVEGIDKRMETAELNGEVGWLLSRLKKQGAGIAIATSNVKRLVVRAIEKHGLEGLIDVVLSGEDVVEHKPDPEVVNVAIERLGGDKESSVIVGDSDKDVEAGRRAGIVSIVYYPRANREFYSMSQVKKLGAEGIATNILELHSLLE